MVSVSPVLMVNEVQVRLEAKVVASGEVPIAMFPRFMLPTLSV